MLVVHIVHVCLCSAKCARKDVCRYQDFVDEGCSRRSAQNDLPVGGNKQDVASAYLDGAEDRPKTGVLCMQCFCRC